MRHIPFAGFYLGALRLGPLTDRWLPPSWPGASASHRTPPRRARRNHDARWSDHWRRVTEQDRRRRGFTRPSSQRLATPVPASAARAARAAVRQSAGTTQRPAADSRWPYGRVSCGAGAGGETKDLGSGPRFASVLTPAGTGCRRPCKQHGAHQGAAREIWPAPAQRHWPAGPGSWVSSPQPARTRRRTPAAALAA